jgi:hypothetical protein
VPLRPRFGKQISSRAGTGHIFFQCHVTRCAEKSLQGIAILVTEPPVPNIRKVNGDVMPFSGIKLTKNKTDSLNASAKGMQSHRLWGPYPDLAFRIARHSVHVNNMHVCDQLM